MERPGRVASEVGRGGAQALLPGYAQWSWDQRERAAVLFGSFATALGVGIFAWGTWTGLAVLVFAFAAHLTSTVDVIRQSAFPGFGRWVPVISASGGLALGVYAPSLLVATGFAWPAPAEGGVPDRYLVNCWAYQRRAPDRGDWVWVRSSLGGDFRVGRVVAAAGQRVEWSEGGARIDGAAEPLRSPSRSGRSPDELAFTVPEGHVLIDLGAARDSGQSSRGLEIIAHDQVAGKAWARFSPLWDRRLLR